MRSMSGKKMKVVASTLMAAAFVGWATVPVAHAGFTVAINGPYADTENPADSVYVLTAKNNGATDTPSNNTGTTLSALDVTISTTATSKLLGIDVEQTGGFGTNLSYTANVTGTVHNLSGEYATNPDPNGQPLFGDGSGGTFIGIGSDLESPSPIVPTAGFDPTYATSAYSTESGATNLEYVNTQTATNNSGFSGTTAAVTGTAANLDPAFKNSSGSVVAGANSTVNGNTSTYSLEVASVTSTGQGPVQANLYAVPFANIVVPTGGSFVAQGSLGGEMGQTVNFSISNSVTTSVNATLSLTSAAPTGSNLVGNFAMSGKNGSYVPQKITGITGAAATTGYVTESGFSPSTDSEVYALEVDSGGTLATGTTLTSIIADLQAGLTASAASGGAMGTVMALAGGSPNITGIFPASNWNVEVVFQAGISPGSFAYNFANDTVNTGVTITGVGLVPEPTSLGILALGGMGLLARRRRMNRVA